MTVRDSAWNCLRRGAWMCHFAAPGFAVGMAVAGHPWLGLSLGGCISLPLNWASFIPASCGFGPVVSRFAPKGNEVWITIDDGPDPQDTPALLDILKKHNAKATFFFIGEKAEKHPELVRRAAEEGHGIGHHTHTHPAHWLWIYSPAATAQEISRGRDAVAKAAGFPPQRRMPFRVPAGIKNPMIHACLLPGEPLVAWSARAFDTVCRRPGEVVRRLMKGARLGAILLMHEGVVAEDGGRLAPRVLEELLGELEKKGLVAVVPEVGVDVIGGGK